MATVLEHISDALTELGILADGEVPTAAQAAHGLRTLNRLVDQWKAERLQIHVIDRSGWGLVSGTSSYTVGTGGVVNIPRPMSIDHVSVLNTTQGTVGLEYPLHKLTEDERAAIPDKSLPGVLPQAWYYDTAYPLGILYFYPVPTSTTLLGFIYAPRAVSTFAAISTAVSLPPGYERLIVKGLAVELAPSYEKQLDPNLIRQAMDAKAVVKASNYKSSDLSFDAGALIGHGGGWDIRQG